MLTRTPAVASKTIPLSIGRYQILGRAGIGVSTAYRARDPETGALVAVHLFPDDAGKPGRLLERLAVTAKECAALDHPNVLRIIDYGPEGGCGYLATEWVEGTTLARMIEVHARLPEANVIRFLAQVAQALDHTRDGETALCRPTPANVLVRNDGQVKLIPFTLLDDSANAALVAPTVVKPEFATALVPESAGVKRVPFAEAIFSLGNLTHEALTGMPWTPPARRSRRRPPPRVVGLTDRTERAIRRATDPEPAKRPASCAEFVKVVRGRSLTAGTPKPDARPAPADDRREGVRYSLGVGSNCTISASVFDPAEVPGTSPEVWPLLLQDVSTSGVGLLLARRCETGTILVVEITTGRTVQTLPARVVRVRKDNFGHWVHGCAFVTPLDPTELTALIDHLAGHDAV